MRIAVLGLVLVSFATEASPQKIVLRPPAWKVGAVWRHEVSWSEDIDLAMGKLRSHRRVEGHQLAEERALAVDDDRVISSEIHVIEDSTTTTDLIAHGDPVVERKPIAGQRYVLHDGDPSGGNIPFAVTRDGHEASATDSADVRALALDVGRLADQLPAHPLAIGDTFALSGDPKDPHQGTARLVKVVDGVAELAVDRTWTLPTAKHHEAGTWRIRVSDGRTLSYELRGMITNAPTHAGSDEIVAKPEAITRAVTYEYTK